MGRCDCMSRLISCIAAVWSSVSGYGNEASNSFCQMLSSG
jgi:hypothetical protein